jgi:hypothetical protein
LQRYKDNGVLGLKELRRKPYTSPAAKLTSGQEQIILSLRHERKLGVRRVQSEIKRLHILL